MTRKTNGKLWSRWRKKTTPHTEQHQEGEQILSKITAQATERLSSTRPTTPEMSTRSDEVMVPLELPEIGSMSLSQPAEQIDDVESGSRRNAYYRDTIIIQKPVTTRYYQSPPLLADPDPTDFTTPCSTPTPPASPISPIKVTVTPLRVHRALSSVRRDGAIARSESPGDSQAQYPDLTAISGHTYEVSPTRADSPTSNGSESHSLSSQSITYVPPQIDDSRPISPVAPLPAHLMQSGLLRGDYCDITLNILGKLYRVHRLVLSRAEFFRQMFEDDGAKAAMTNNSSETPIVSVYMEDPVVDVASVDAIITWLYGGPMLAIHDSSQTGQYPNAVLVHTDNVLMILRAAILFQIKPIVDFCIEFIAEFDLAVSHRRAIAHRKFNTLTASSEITKSAPVPTILRYIDFVENYTFSQTISETVEDALLSYLCTDGYEHLHDTFVHLPLSWLERILEADAFWCPNDFSRYEFTRSVVLQRRLNSLKCKESEKLQKVADRVYADIFRYAMIYSNMTFEQLNEVRLDGLVSDQILMKALALHTQYQDFVKMSDADQSQTENEDTGTQMKVYLAPMRVGVEFKNIHALTPDERLYATTFFCGGSWWSVFLQRFPEKKKENEISTKKEVDSLMKAEKWGLFLRRADGKELTALASLDHEGKDPMAMFNAPPISNAIQVLNSEALDAVHCPLTGAPIDRSVSYYYDQRNIIRASFKLFNPMKKAHEPIFESKMNDYAENQSWGYRSRDNVITQMDCDAAQLFAETDQLTTIKFSLILNFEQPQADLSAK